jgi:hypothetical protein
LTKSESGKLIARRKNLDEQWAQLCQWFKSHAAEAASKTKSERTGEIIFYTVAVFCRDDPPKTPEGLTAFRSFAEHQVDLWTTAPLPESDGEMPTVAVRVREAKADITHR